MTWARPTRAFILAAGFGTRMLPLTRDLPKPMLPLWGVPMLEHTLRLLERWGVRDALVNLHHQPGEILEWVRQRRGSLRIALSFEPDILGTGGALRHAAWFLGNDPIWLINADVACDLNPEPLLRAFRSPRTLASVWLHESLGPRTVELRAGHITGFHAPHPGADGTHTFCGLHLVSPRILDFLPPSGFAGIIEAYERAMRRGARIAGVTVPRSYWADIGSPAAYLDAHRDILEAYRTRKPGARLFTPSALRRGRGCYGFVAAAPDAVIERGAHLRDAVLLPGAVIRRTAEVRGAIVGRNTTVRAQASHIVMRADQALEKDELRLLKRLGVNPATAKVECMGPRGSARSFRRIRSTHGSFILMRYSLERAENAFYAGHARFLARIGLRAPAIVIENRRARLALIEDLGNASLEDFVPHLPPTELRTWYRQVLNAVLTLHTRGTRAAQRAHLRLMPAFDAETYRWERDLFAEQVLKKHLHWPPARVRAAKLELARVAQRLLDAPPVLVHRDLQSSNILIHNSRPAFIDFQGMRYGAAAYDLASLLCDPYVMLDEPTQASLLHYYLSRSPNAAVTRACFHPAAIERLAQALGAYVRLGHLPGMERFLLHIHPAAEQLRRALKQVPGLPILTRAAAELRA